MGFYNRVPSKGTIMGFYIEFPLRLLRLIIQTLPYP